MYGKKTSVLNIPVTETQAARLKEYAAALDMSMAAVCRAALNNFIAQNPPPKHDPLPGTEPEEPEPPKDTTA